MSNFWPSDLNIKDTQSPMEILQVAQNDFQTESQGLITLIMQIAKSQSGNDMIIVHAKHVPSNRTRTLFTVVHRPNSPYPASIVPRDEKLPNFLKKSYYKAGILERTAPDFMTSGSEVENKWVCDTPSEFRSKLREVIELGSTKADILNLLSNDDSDDTDSSAEAHPEATEATVES